jgi:hypothetical protein
MTLSPPRPLRRWSTRALLLGVLFGGVAFARHRTISRHEIDLRSGLAARAEHGAGHDRTDDDSGTDHTDRDRS